MVFISISFLKSAEDNHKTILWKERAIWINLSFLTLQLKRFEPIVSLWTLTSSSFPAFNHFTVATDWKVCGDVIVMGPGQCEDGRPLGNTMKPGCQWLVVVGVSVGTHVSFCQSSPGQLWSERIPFPRLWSALGDKKSAISDESNSRPAGQIRPVTAFLLVPRHDVNVPVPVIISVFIF